MIHNKYHTCVPLPNLEKNGSILNQGLTLKILANKQLFCPGQPARILMRMGVD